MSHLIPDLVAADNHDGKIARGSLVDPATAPAPLYDYFIFGSIYKDPYPYTLDFMYSEVW